MSAERWTTVRVKRSTADLIKNLSLELAMKTGKDTNADDVVNILWVTYQAARLKAESLAH